MGTTRRVVGRSRRLAAAAAAVVLAATAATACEPTPVLDLTVTTPLDRRDAAPGDGVCEATAGAGDCTLRAALSEAGATDGPDRITIAAGVDPVLSLVGRVEDANLTGDLDITGEVTIEGGGATIDGAGLDRVFDVRSGRLTLRDATITGGHPPRFEAGTTLGAGGGAAVRTYGRLVLERATVTGNTAEQSTEGAAIVGVGAAISLVATEVADNAFLSTGGDAMVLLRDGSLHLDRSTVEAPVDTAVQSYRATVIATDSTIVAREALSVVSARGGIVRSTLVSTPSPFPGELLSAGSGSLSIAGSIIDDDAAGPSHDICSFTTRPRVTSGGGNVASDDSCALGGAGDVQGGPVLVHALAENGGPTRTALPADGSPALDRSAPGTAYLCDGAVDQRGVARPAGAACDAGAVEGRGGPLVGLDLTVDTAADAVDAAPGDGICAAAGGACTLRAAVMEANAHNPAQPGLEDTITIAAGVAPVLSLPGRDEDAGATGDLDVVGRTRIEGGGATVDGGGVDRVLDVAAQVLTLHEVTVTGGAAVGDSLVTGDGGGVRGTNGEIVVDRSTIRGNTAQGNGGGVASEDVVTVVDSDIADNHADRYGGGLSPSTASVSRSLIRGNSAGWGGGGIGRDFGSVAVGDSTISGNSSSSGAAVAITLDFTIGASLVRTTVVGNTGGPSLAIDARYCGRFCQEWKALTALGSIIVAPAGTPACSGTLPEPGTNLAPDGSCGASLPGAALLGPLTDVGGPTPVHVPGAGSAAIDALPTSAPASLCAGDLRDQRGTARPQGPACDVGAVEQ